MADRWSEKKKIHPMIFDLINIMKPVPEAAPIPVYTAGNFPERLIAIDCRLYWNLQPRNNAGMIRWPKT